MSTLIYTVNETFHENIKQIQKNLFFKTFIKKSNIFLSIKSWTKENLGKVYSVLL